MLMCIVPSPPGASILLLPLAQSLLLAVSDAFFCLLKGA